MSKHGIFEVLGHLHTGKESLFHIDFTITVNTQKIETSKQICMKSVLNNHLRTLPLTSHEIRKNYSICLQESTAHYDRKSSHCSPFTKDSASRSSLVQFISHNTFLSSTSKTTSTKILQCKPVLSTEKCLSPDSNPEYLIKSTGSCSMLLSAPALSLNFIQCNKVLQKKDQSAA